MAKRTEPEAPKMTGKAATQERILVAATELFVSGGYERTTMADIAERAGVSRATVFWHFSEKASLFRESFSRLLAPFRESLEQDFDDVAPRKRLEEQLAMSEQFARDLDLTAAQRQLKAVGIFARLDLRDGKASHLRHIPPVLDHLAALSARHETLAPLGPHLAAWQEAAERRLGARR